MCASFVELILGFFFICCTLVATIEADHQKSHGSHEQNHCEGTCKTNIDCLGRIVHVAIIHLLARLLYMATSNDPQTTAFLRERYGNTATKNWRSGWKLPALLIALLGGLWIAWSGTHVSNPEIRSSLISFHSTSAQSIQIRYSLQFKHPGGNHQCTLVARDLDKNTVGEIVDHIPLGQASITREVSIPTRLQAVNAAILSCSSL